MQPWEQKLEGVLVSWEGTRFMRSQGIKGVGVDCLRFVDRVLCELYGVEMPPLPRLPPGVSLHDRNGVLMQCGALMRRWPHQELDISTVRESGDVVLARPGTGPCHVFIVGPLGCAWHAGAAGVARSALVGWTLEKLYRLNGKELW